jgi:poly(3-hydroxybutyrate) depolymerase
MQMNKLIGTCLLCAWVWGTQANAQESIKVGNTTRNMITYAPEGLPYNPPLVISLHGMNQDANYQKGQANWEAVADTAKFVVVYPNGINKAWDISGDTDIKFLETVIDTMYNRYHINRNRVYLSGFSMGGMMTYHAMARMSDKIAAFGPVSGIPVDYRNPSGRRAVPIIHTHGTADNVVYYNGDANHPAGGYGSIPEYVKKWAAFDGCDMNPEVIKPYPAGKPGSSATYTRYSGGKDGVEVVLISIEGKGHWHSNDPASVMTTEEIWNFCKRYSLGPEEPEPPALVSAEPENHSFDLPSQDLAFVYTFDEAVDGGEAKAILSGEGMEYPLVLSESGFSKRLTFRLPDGVQLPDGDYTLRVEHLENEAGGVLQSCVFTYTIGVVEVGDELAIETLLSPVWREEQAVVGEGIPTGWKRVNSRKDGTKDEKGSGAANTGGARLKYFPEGGDFDAGFYLSARDYDVCDFYFGSYDGYRLHLLPGQYVLSFNSVYWSAGSEEGKATFDVQVTDGTGKGVWSQVGLLSSGCMDEVSTEKVKGSKAHEYVFSITSEGNYELHFTMSQGWNSIILGGIRMTTQPSVADVYKGGFLRLMKEAARGYEATASDCYAASEDLRTALKIVLDQYEGFVSTAPSEYEEAMEAVEAVWLPLADRKESVDVYVNALETAQEALSGWEKDGFDLTAQAYLDLKEAVRDCAFGQVDMTDNLRMRDAAESLSGYVQKLREEALTVDGVTVSGRPVSVEHYDLSGRRIKPGCRGVTVVRELYRDGSVRVQKRLNVFSSL